MEKEKKKKWEKKKKRKKAVKTGYEPNVSVIAHG